MSASPVPSPQQRLRLGDPNRAYAYSDRGSRPSSPIREYSYSSRRPDGSIHQHSYSATDYAFSDIASSLRPVQEYHNAFAHADNASATASPFDSFTSASRAFLAHRRQQSIPNLLPAVASIGKSLGRAISPDRSSRLARLPIPAFKTESCEVQDKVSPGGDEHDSDSDSDGDVENDSDVENDEEDDNRHSMASHVRDIGAMRNSTTIYTTYTSSRKNRNAAADNHIPEPHLTPTLRTSRTSGSIRSLASHDASPLTPKNAAPPLASVTSPSSASTSRFTQFAQSMVSRFSQPSPASARPAAGSRGGAALEGDEFYHLDIHGALFPSGNPSDRDAFSPSAFKNLEVNATRTLARMQEAYRQRAVAMMDIAVEKSAVEDELEEAETRAQNFKMQLEGMSRRAAQNEADMMALLGELTAEKKARAQERAMLVAGMPLTATALGSAGAAHDLRDEDQATNAMSEDLGVEEAQHRQKHRRQWRKSLKSSDGSYDDTDDGDEESTPDDESSVFSRSRSPTIAPSINFDSVDTPSAVTTLTLTPAPSTPTPTHPRVAALGSSARPAKPASPSQSLSPFQKLVKNVTGGPKDEDREREPDNCRNCRGQDVSFAWNTVSVLRDENKQLKQRVSQLEVAVEGALDVVNGLGL